MRCDDGRLQTVRMRSLTDELNKNAATKSVNYWRTDGTQPSKRPQRKNSTHKCNAQTRSLIGDLSYKFADFATAARTHCHDDALPLGRRQEEAQCAA